MPRPKKDTDVEPKRRSRTGCWPCKKRKIKCDEARPACANCVKSNETCDYSIRLNWGGRSRKDRDGTPADADGFTFVATPASTAIDGRLKADGHGHEHVFSSQHIATAPSRPTSGHSSSLPTPDQTPHIRQATSSSHPDPGHRDPRSHPSGYATTSRSGQSSSIGPFDSTSPDPALNRDEYNWSSPRGAKRRKMSPAHHRASPSFAVPQYPLPTEPSASTSAYLPHNINSIFNAPATPNSSNASTSPYPSAPSTLGVQDAPSSIRRLSVKSLLADPEDYVPPSFKRIDTYGDSIYGWDHGFEDLDVPRNDDLHVILPQSPDLRRPSAVIADPLGAEEGKQIAFEPGGYYAQPVPIKIPRALEPLPRELLENQMNLLYFHHFINHTGRIMVTHDCPENPFRGVLPLMAVRNPHLLHLLLAFSASHRAKLLNHPEPANRIAQWKSDVIPALRHALSEPATPGSVASDSADPSPLAPLATAIMLASYEVILPTSFSTEIPWQTHLAVARELIVAKGGLGHLAQQANGARDKAIFFLSRWFAYLDVIGSLSSRRERPLAGAYLEDGGGRWLVNRDNAEIYQIDCFFGFSGRCISLLAQVAEMTATSDNERIDPVTNQIKAGWTPAPRVRVQAEELQTRLRESASHEFQGCMHNHPHAAGDLSHAGDSFDLTTNYEELNATNRAYHFAGSIHLSRRVLAQPSSSPEIQNAVREIIQCLRHVRRGSSAESCLLLPMFTAGCEALREEQRQLFMDRLKDVEGWGMQHVGRLRSVMQTVWDTGTPWETLVDGEFLG